MMEKFTQKSPAYEIYAEIFSVKLHEYITTGMFIRRKQALFAELPRPHPEDVQLDMLYSLLKAEIQKKVPRDSVVSIDQLIDAANRVEHAKNKKRVGKYRNIDIEAMKIASKLKEKCSRCRRSIRSGQMANVDVDCYKCNLRRANDKAKKKRIFISGQQLYK